MSISGSMSSLPSSGSRRAKPLTAEAYTTCSMANSSCASSAPRSIMRSRQSLRAFSGLAPSRSILLMQIMICKFASMACERTKRVWGMGPSAASTSSTAPSAILSTRSTSPPKSAWPGVSMTLILMPWYSMEMFLARIVMPRSRSWSLESRTRSSTCWFSRKALVAFSIWSTSVVLPWSTCAMIAMLRMCSWSMETSS